MLRLPDLIHMTSIRSQSHKFLNLEWIELVVSVMFMFQVQIILVGLMRSVIGNPQRSITHAGLEPQLDGDLIKQVGIIASAKEVMFLPALVCLSVSSLLAGLEPQLDGDLIKQVGIIASAKEVVFLLALVCLFVCLSVCLLAVLLKKDLSWQILMKFSGKVKKWHKDQYIRFYQWSR